jgi:dolichol-phosphate mannosyltransferase
LTPRVSVIIPVFNEGNSVEPILRRMSEAIDFDHEIIVVYDHDDDTTIPTLLSLHEYDNRFKPLKNTLGSGPAKAIRSGISAAKSQVVVVTMADGCDDPDQITQLTKLVERGVVIACASRYSKGGRQIGGPFLKSTLSRLAGRILYHFARVGTRDATNSYKAYSRVFIEEVGIESEQGFEIGLELVAKARSLKKPVAEIPTIWLDRAFGESNFKFSKWLPHYVKWFLYAFGIRLSTPQRRK